MGYQSTPPKVIGAPITQEIDPSRGESHGCRSTANPTSSSAVGSMPAARRASSVSCSFGGSGGGQDDTFHPFLSSGYERVTPRTNVYDVVS